MGIVISNNVNRNRTRRIIRRSNLINEINVTPFVDVMLVLLIVFMVSAPLLTTGVTVNLPDNKAGLLNAQNQPITVSIDRQGKIFLQEMEVLLDEVVVKLKIIAENGYNERIYIRGDRDSNYGVMMNVMAKISTAGFKKIALVTLPLK